MMKELPWQASSLPVVKTRIMVWKRMKVERGYAGSEAA